MVVGVRIVDMSESGLLSHLEVLQITFNQQLTGTLPTTLGKLTALQNLYGWNASLESLPDSVGHLASLQKVCEVSWCLSGLALRFVPIICRRLCVVCARLVVHSCVAPCLVGGSDGQPYFGCSANLTGATFKGRHILLGWKHWHQVPTRTQRQSLVVNSEVPRQPVRVKWGPNPSKTIAPRHATSR